LPTRGNPKPIVHRETGRRHFGRRHAQLLFASAPTAICSLCSTKRCLTGMEGRLPSRSGVFEQSGEIESESISIATFLSPRSQNDRDYVAIGGTFFGPHNIHENRPGSFQSSTLIFLSPPTRKRGGAGLRHQRTSFPSGRGRRPCRAAGSEENWSTRVPIGPGRPCISADVFRRQETAFATCNRLERAPACTSWSTRG